MGLEPTQPTQFLHLCIIYNFASYVTILLIILGDLKFLWKDISKIIDSLHIRNHVDSKCKELYDPGKLKSKFPDVNTMACEQTFAWLSRYKKIVCSMPKVHHHFYLHRMVKRRNSYISHCYKLGRKPQLD